MKLLYVVNKPSSSKVSAVCESPASCVGFVNALISLGSFLPSDILDDDECQLLEARLGSLEYSDKPVTLKVSSGNFRITPMLLV